MNFSMENIKDRMSQKQFEEMVNISIKNKYVFFCASKCASSTLKYYFQAKELETTNWKVEKVDDKRYSPLLSPFQLGEDQFLNIINRSDYRKFCFARNPYERVLSNYIYKIVHSTRSHPARQFRRKSGHDVNASFEDFVKFICDQNLNDMNPHWRPIYYSTFADRIDYDFIGKVENLKGDILTISKKIFGPDSYQLEGVLNSEGRPLIKDGLSKGEPVDNPFSKKRGKYSAEAEIEKYYSRNLIDLINEKYHYDFHYFGYEKM